RAIQKDWPPVYWMPFGSGAEVDPKCEPASGEDPSKKEGGAGFFQPLRELYRNAPHGRSMFHFLVHLIFDSSMYHRPVLLCRGQASHLRLPDWDNPHKRLAESDHHFPVRCMHEEIFQCRFLHQKEIW